MVFGTGINHRWLRLLGTWAWRCVEWRLPRSFNFGRRVRRRDFRRLLKPAFAVAAQFGKLRQHKFNGPALLAVHVRAQKPLDIAAQFFALAVLKSFEQLRAIEVK